MNKRLGLSVLYWIRGNAWKFIVWETKPVAKGIDAKVMFAFDKYRLLGLNPWQYCVDITCEFGSMQMLVSLMLVNPLASP